MKSHRLSLDIAGLEKKIRQILQGNSWERVTEDGLTFLNKEMAREKKQKNTCI